MATPEVLQQQQQQQQQQQLLLPSGPPPMEDIAVDPFANFRSKMQTSPGLSPAAYPPPQGRDLHNLHDLRDSLMVGSELVGEPDAAQPAAPSASEPSQAPAVSYAAAAARGAGRVSSAKGTTAAANRAPPAVEHRKPATRSGDGQPLPPAPFSQGSTEICTESGDTDELRILRMLEEVVGDSSGRGAAAHSDEAADVWALRGEEEASLAVVPTCGPSGISNNSFTVISAATAQPPHAALQGSFAHTAAAATGRQPPLHGSPNLHRARPPPGYAATAAAFGLEPPLGGAAADSLAAPFPHHRAERVHPPRTPPSFAAAVASMSGTPPMGPASAGHVELPPPMPKEGGSRPAAAAEALIVRNAHGVFLLHPTGQTVGRAAPAAVGGPGGSPVPSGMSVTPTMRPPTYASQQGTPVNPAAGYPRSGPPGASPASERGGNIGGSPVPPYALPPPIGTPPGPANFLGAPMLNGVHLGHSMHLGGGGGFGHPGHQGVPPLPPPYMPPPPPPYGA